MIQRYATVARHVCTAGALTLHMLNLVHTATTERLGEWLVVEKYKRKDTPLLLIAQKGMNIRQKTHTCGIRLEVEDGQLDHAKNARLLELPNVRG